MVRQWWVTDGLTDEATASWAAAEKSRPLPAGSRRWPACAGRRFLCATRSS